MYILDTSIVCQRVSQTATEPLLDHDSGQTVGSIVFATQLHITQLEKLEKLIQSMNICIAIATKPGLISRRIICSERTSS